MAMEVPFWEEQTFVGASAPVIYLSPPFDVSPYSLLSAWAIIQGVLGTSPAIIASLLGSPTLAVPDSAWLNLTTFSTISAPATLAACVTPATICLPKFVRASLLINPSDHIVTLSLKGIARESS